MAAAGRKFPRQRSEAQVFDEVIEDIAEHTAMGNKVVGHIWAAILIIEKESKLPPMNFILYIQYYFEENGFSASLHMAKVLTRMLMDVAKQVLDHSEDQKPIVVRYVFCWN